MIPSLDIIPISSSVSLLGDSLTQRQKDNDLMSGLFEISRGRTKNKSRRDSLSMIIKDLMSLSGIYRAYIELKACKWEERPEEKRFRAKLRTELRVKSLKI